MKTSARMQRFADKIALIEIPQALYDAIKDADNIRKLLRKSLRTDDHNTTIDAYVAKPPTPPKKKKIKRTISTHFHALLMLLVIDMDKANETLAGLPTINGTALTGEEQKVWKNFTRMNIKVYVKEHGSKNITQAVPLVCEYYKLTLKYCFYVTLDAIEQGKPGLYKAVVECDRVTGARTLCQFSLTDHKTKWETVPEEILLPDLRSFHQESEYEKAWSSDESEPEDFYDISGMVHRMATTGGGFNYQNPSSTLHRYILNDGRNRMYRGVEV
ncbi:hypothetical protein Tco_1406767 [Tanacetum coccineum]